MRHEQHEIKFTISLGVAELNEGIVDYKSWLEHSDQALYESKEGGRNRITLFGV